MRPGPAVITSNAELFENYQELRAGDIICCRIRLKPGEEHLLLDLAARGITAFPSLTAQLCSRSKAFQTRLFGAYMLPGTTVIYTIHDLLHAIGRYGRDGITRVVLKQEGKNGGLGVFLFSSIEEVYTQTASGIHPFPFVIQPFVSDYHDLRVIILGDYIEVYERVNPGSFRHNLHCGGSPKPYLLSAAQRQLCDQVMTRGAFPYAHLDLMVTDDGRTFLTEINLRGGLRGAAISSPDYRSRLAAIDSGFCEEAIKKGATRKGSPRHSNPI